MDEYNISGNIDNIKLEYLKEIDSCKMELTINSNEEIITCNFLLEFKDFTKISLMIAAIANEYKGKEYLEEIYEELKSEKGIKYSKEN